MKHTSKSLAEYLQSLPDLPVCFTSDYSNFFDEIKSQDISVVWLQKTTQNEEYPNYGEDLNDLIEDYNEFKEDDEPEITKDDFIQVLLISRG
jgi:ATP-dependent helicase/DNAse subunit B